MYTVFRFLCFFLICFQTISANDAYIVGIAGGSGSGKTRLAQKIKAELGDDAVLIEQDAYYKDLSHLGKGERAKKNFDHPDAIDFSLLSQQLDQLKRMEPIDRPTYDFKTHTRTSEFKTINPARIIIVEGILILAVPEMRELFDLKIYVETEDDIRLLRRLERDLTERGRDLDAVKSQYISTVKPMHHLFVAPSKAYADVIIPSFEDTNAAEGMIMSRLKEVLEIASR